MKHTRTILLIFVALALVQAACNIPRGPASRGSATFAVPPTFVKGQATPTPGAGSGPGTGGHGDGPCTYQMSFIADVTIPDDTTIKPGASFVKTWRVRNDGTCTWGPQGYALHAVAHTGGDKFSAPDSVPLPSEVKQGQTVDISVPMVAPVQPGTYTSQWMLLIENDPNGAGPNLGLGDKKDEPLYVRIKVQ